MKIIAQPYMTKAIQAATTSALRKQREEFINVTTPEIRRLQKEVDDLTLEEQIQEMELVVATLKADGLV